MPDKESDPVLRSSLDEISCRHMLSLLDGTRYLSSHRQRHATSWLSGQHALVVQYQDAIYDPRTDLTGQ